MQRENRNIWQVSKIPPGLPGTGEQSIGCKGGSVMSGTGGVNEVTQWSGPLEKVGGESRRLRYHSTLRSMTRESSL